jgi:hypothetical protein
VGVTVVVRLHGQARWHIVRAEADGMTGVACGRGWESRFLERADVGDVLEGLPGLRCHRCVHARRAS